MDATTGITQCGKYAVSNWHYTGQEQGGREAGIHLYTIGLQRQWFFSRRYIASQNAEDIKCDENGSWVNWGSGVSKLWLQSDLYLIQAIQEMVRMN